MTPEESFFILLELNSSIRRPNDGRLLVPAKAGQEIKVNCIIRQLLFETALPLLARESLRKSSDMRCLINQSISVSLMVCPSMMMQAKRSTHFDTFFVTKTKTHDTFISQQNLQWVTLFFCNKNTKEVVRQIIV